MDDLFYADNVIEISERKESAIAREEEAYKEFRAFLDADDKLYRHWQTYYIKMRNADDKTKKYYNEIKNELMSHVDREQPSIRVRYELKEDSEIFYLSNVIAQFHMVGGTLLFYLRLDPSKYKTQDAIHKDVSKDPDFVDTPLMLKINKLTRVQKAIALVRDLVNNSKSTKDDKYIDVDYASFFSRDVLFVARNIKDENSEEVIEQVVPLKDEELRSDDVILLSAETEEDDTSVMVSVVTTKEAAYNNFDEESGEKNEDSDDASGLVTAEQDLPEPYGDQTNDVVIEEKEEALVEQIDDEELPQEPDKETETIYKNVADPQERPSFRGMSGIQREPMRPQNIYEEEEKKSIFKEKGDEADDKTKKKKPNLWQELSSYGYNFVLLKQLEFYAIAIALAVGLGLLYQLKWPFILVLVITVLISLPSVLTAYYRNKYEEKRYRDIESYIEQMLYSFRRNSKILMSLNDALVVFPNGYMHDRIIEAIDHIRSSRKEGNVYEQALRIIEEAYPCRRVKSLHRYMIKVEGIGGKHEAGVNALLKDRRQWIDRTAMFRRQCGGLIKEILVSGIFSLAMACVILYMMPNDLFVLSSSIIYQIVTTIFVMVNLLVIRTTLKSTVVYLQDEDEASAKKTVKLINWLRNYNAKAELKKGIKQSAIFMVLVAVAFILKNALFILIGGLMIIFTIFLKPKLDRRSAMKRARREIEKVYPDWLLELALLLQTDNLHVAIEKTLDTAPLIIRYDLRKLADDILTHPVDLAPYIGFFDFLPMETVQSSMKLLYSISTFGAVDESVQISELVERNHTLMEQAEKYRNDDKLARVFTIKFVPMLSSSVKMLVDLMLFLFSYLSLIGDMF